jgi:hypothetical protein
MPLHSVPDPEEMTASRKLMLRVGKEPVQYNGFNTQIVDRGELGVGVVEMRSFEDYTPPPRPDNDVYAAVVLVAWTRSMVSVMEKLDIFVYVGRFQLGATLGWCRTRMM